MSVAFFARHARMRCLVVVSRRNCLTPSVKQMNWTLSFGKRFNAVAAKSAASGLVRAAPKGRLVWVFFGCTGIAAVWRWHFAVDIDVIPVASARIPVTHEQSRKRRLLSRLAWLLWSFSLVIACIPLAALSTAFRERYYYWLIYKAVFSSRSAAFAKWSQWASVRMDLFPATLCVYLAQLQSFAPTHDVEHSMTELQEAGFHVVGAAGGDSNHSASARGVPANMVLVEFNEKPLASGSIAQVHRARCGDIEVVVKIRHPRVAEEMLLDFELMSKAAGAIHDWVPALRWLNAPSTVAQFEEAMSGQCDLSSEAANIRRFQSNFKQKKSWVVFPEVLCATSAVLVESYEPGVLMSDFVRMHRGQILEDDDRSAARYVINRGEDAYLQMLLTDNFMHADLHPGNIVFREDSTSRKRQIVLLDAGLAVPLTNDERKNFIGFLQAIGDGNGDVLAERVMHFSSKGPTGNIDGFTSDVNQLCSTSCHGYGTGVDISDVLQQLMRLMYKHGVTIGGNYAMLMANALCLEGMARDLEPKFSILDVSYPLLRSHQLLGDQNFQRCFRSMQKLIPLWVWEHIYSALLYGAMHGESLKPLQI
eukprot:TRINITY_DN35456_c0_g1_i1.p1 TRINITY_DN35456_c0_g1~~TRINITY_DN35456_c0_g1_i1.p1  ORF type:complete len:591 (-),score=87.91 TRINITY_DN35456_c0_g1_i1:102-1874(-)